MYEIFVQLMEEKGVTPYRVYKETGVAQSSLSDWKNGKSVPKIDKMKAIAKYFNVSVEYLMGETDEKNKAPSESDNSDDTLMFALYGGDNNSDITPDMLEDVRNYAKFIRERNKKKK